MNKHKEWQCPYCSNPSKLMPNIHYNTQTYTLKNLDVTKKYKQFKKDESKEYYNYMYEYCIQTEGIACPNPQCEELTLTAKLFVNRYRYNKNDQLASRPKLDAFKKINDWQIMPKSSCKIFPDYIPKRILEDYKEACAIKTLSPKASATLARRCLQGMVRDFFDIEDKTLYDELSQIKDKVTEIIRKAIDRVREYGNAGAHPMKQDVDKIVDIKEGEVDKLIWLIELLFDEWYVKRHETDKKLKEIESMGESKTNQPTQT